MAHDRRSSATATAKRTRQGRPPSTGDTPAPHTAWFSPPRRAGLLVALVLVLAAQRLHTYDEPLERDLTTYAVIAHESLGGRALYTELWDNKSPLVYATYALGELVAGYGPRALFLLGLGAAVVTLLGVEAAAAATTESTVAGLWAAASWTLVSADQALQANQPNIEVFMNACVVWLFVLVTAPKTRPVLIGVVSAIASLYKLVTIPTLVLFAAVHFAMPPVGSSRRAALRGIALAMLTAAGVWAVMVGYFAVTGRGDVFREAVFAYNANFAGNQLDNVVTGLAPGRLASRALWCALPLALLSLVGSVWLVRVGSSRVAALWLAYVVGTALSVALPGKFWPHYYQLWLPVCAIGAGIGVHAIGRPAWRGSLVGAAALLAVVAVELPHYAESAEEWALAKYGPEYVDVKRMAPAVDALLAPGETFFDWGDDSGFYYYTGRHPPTRFLYLYATVVKSPMRGALEARLLADLERTKPELLIANTAYLNRELRSLPVVAWLDEAYYAYEDDREHGAFRLFVRRGGALDRRLQQ